MIGCSIGPVTDVLEATVDGNNTFHCTQMMVWQRGPVPQQSHDDSERENVLRPRAIKPSALQEFQRLDHVHLPSGKRPRLHSVTTTVEWFGSTAMRKGREHGPKIWLG